MISTSGCDATTISTEGTTTKTCNWQYTWGTGHSDAVVRIDKTAPTASQARSRGHRTQTAGSTSLSRPASAGRTSSRESPPVGVRRTRGSIRRVPRSSGTCKDVAGNVSAAASVSLKYDATAPTVSPAVDRPPDSKGWYRKPVTVSFAGTDLTSGIAACTAPTQYAGPDLPQAAVVGSCRDSAGNSAEAGQTFQYDATAPALARTEVKVEKGIARVGWERAGDVVAVELVRSPGINGAKSTIVYQGNGAAFVDKTVKAGVRYRYDVSVADLAGNVTTKAVMAAAAGAAKTSTSLLAPVAGAVVKAPPLLRWKAVKGATFYNVQVYRNGRKLLSTWPGAAKLKLKRTWTYAGKRYRLQPGVYKWYVWGARGTRAKPVYGNVLGSSTFSVKR